MRTYEDRRNDCMRLQNGKFLKEIIDDLEEQQSRATDLADIVKDLAAEVADLRSRLQADSSVRVDLGESLPDPKPGEPGYEEWEKGLNEVDPEGRR